MRVQLPENIIKKAVKGIGYIAHPLRLRILEFVDVSGASSVSVITKAVEEEQVIVSQSLKKLREANLVKTERRGIFILFGYITDDFRFLADDYKAILPRDYTNMVANQIKLFANYDKMRILEFLTLYGESRVSDIVEGIGSDKLKVSQYLKRMKDDGFVVCRKEGRFVFYNITKGVHKTAVECIHRRYEKLDNKEEF